MRNRRNQPLSARLLERLLPSRDREMILGDLEQASMGFGRLKRFFWYWHQVLAFAIYSVLKKHTRKNRLSAGLLGGVMEDVRVGVRSVLRTPVYFALTVGTITLGIGASTAILGVVNGVLLSPLDQVDPETLVSIWTNESGLDYAPLSPPDLKAIAQGATGLEAVAGRWVDELPLLGEGPPTEISVASVTDEYFTVLRSEPLLGSLLSRDEPTGVVVSEEFWRDALGASPSAIGSQLQVGNEILHVIGILPLHPGPNVPNIAGVLEQVDVWRIMPLSWLDWDWDTSFLRVMARLEEGTTVAQFNQELSALMREVNTIAGRAPDELDVFAISLKDHLVATVRPTLLLLLAAVAVIVSVAVANLAQLTLARSAGRQTDLSIRAALGASRWRVARALLAESLVVGLVGGSLGLLMGWWSLEAMVALQPTVLPRLDEVGLTPTVVMAAGGVTAIASLCIGLMPALILSRGSLARELTTRQAAFTRRLMKTSRALVVAEITMTFVLLAGSGLLLKTFVALSSVDPGYDAEGVLTMSITPMRGDSDDLERSHFLRELLDGVAEVPGVTAVGVTNRLPLGGGVFTGKFASRENFAHEDSYQTADIRFVSPGFFEAMGVDLRSGRHFTDGDPGTVAIIDESMAQSIQADDPIGQEVWTDGFGINDWATVVGVVEHVRHASVTENTLPTVYYNALAEPATSTWRTVVRHEPHAKAGLLGAVETVLRSADPQATISRVRSMSDRLSEALAVQTMAFTLFTLFALAAVLLAVLGIYGVMAISVNQQRRELAVRMALGATRSEVAGVVLRQGILLTIIGLLFGSVVAVAATRAMEGILYGVQPLDLTVLLAAATCVVIVGLAGCFVPARRAITVDPMQVLEH